MGPVVQLDDAFVRTGLTVMRGTGSYRTGFTILALLAGSGVTFFALASPPAPPVRQPSPELVSR